MKHPFEIDFSTYLSSLTNLTDSSYIEIYYTATVNSDATIGSSGNENEAKVTYGDASTSTVSTTETYVYDLYIYKYTGTLNSGETALSGAQFQLTNTVSDKIALAVLNNSGSTIPTTGGIGTTIFYVVGAVPVIGAAVILITRRRMGNRV